ncbi:MAG: hypothetical protein GXO85_02185 [Chlorobi bacterium]|nr:hypothetical protein [Chlorobiota bacterium]
MLRNEQWIIGGIFAAYLLWGNDELDGVGKITDSTYIRPRSRVDTDFRNISYPTVKTYHPDRIQPTNAKHWKKYSLSSNSAVQFFKLYSLEFGNWVTQNERLNYLYGITESLKNMARVIPSMQNHKIGFNKRLTIAVGARGTGGPAVAFYQGTPLYLINLTRHNGPGALGHEWGHALDQYLAHRYLNNSSAFVSSGSVSDSIRKRINKDILDSGHPIEKLFEQLFAIILWKEKEVPTEYHLFLLYSDSKYLNRRVEIFARVMEGYFRFKFKLQGIRDYMTITRTRERDEPPPHLIRKAIPIINKILSYATS